MKKSLVDTKYNPCKEKGDVGYDSNWGAQDANTVTKACSALYILAAKCQKDLDGGYHDRNMTGCALVAELWGAGLLSRAGDSVPVQVIAGVFGTTTALLSAGSVLLYRKNRRVNVRLVVPLLALVQFEQRQSTGRTVAMVRLEYRVTPRTVAFSWRCKQVCVDVANQGLCLYNLCT